MRFKSIEKLWRQQTIRAKMFVRIVLTELLLISLLFCDIKCSVGTEIETNATIKTFCQHFQNENCEISSQLVKFEESVDKRLKLVESTLQEMQIMLRAMHQPYPEDECKDVDPTPEQKKLKLLRYLRSISGFKTISGQGAHYVTNAEAEEIKSITGVYPGLWYSQVKGNNDFSTFTDTAISQWTNGSLVFALIEVSSPITNNCCDQLSSAQWNELLLDGSVLNKQWKTKLDLMVPHLKKLEKAGVVSIVDFYLEMNNDIRWWGKAKEGKGIKLYQMTHDYVTKHHGLNSLVWVWSVLHEWEDLKSIQEFWPGSKYVDVVSLSLWNHNEPTIQEYHDVLRIACGKPIVLRNNKSLPKLDLFTRQPKWAWFSRVFGNLNSSTHSEAIELYHDARIVNQNEINFFTPNPTLINLH